MKVNNPPIQAVERGWGRDAEPLVPLGQPENTCWRGEYPSEGAGGGEVAGTVIPWRGRPGCSRHGQCPSTAAAATLGAPSSTDHPPAGTVGASAWNWMAKLQLSQSYSECPSAEEGGEAAAMVSASGEAAGTASAALEHM
jgi:hypothetical protein